MKIIEKKIEDIKPYDNNAKQHPEKQIELLIKNIKKFGFTTPCLIDENNNLIAGHGRLEAVKKLNWKKVPCVKMEGLTEKEIKALRLADNKIAEMGEWDMELAIEELKGLDEEMEELTGFDLDLLIETGDNGNDWNYNYKEVEQVGDGLVDKLGFAPHSMWYNIPRDYGNIKNYLVKLPDCKNSNTHKNKYSRTNPESIRRIIKMYMREGDFFLENCCGWSTFGSIAKHEGFSGVGVDIWDTAIQLSEKQAKIMQGKGNLDIQKMDGMDLKFEDEYFDYVYCNPPFMDAEMYSGDGNDIATKDRDEFESKFQKLMNENFRVLKKDCLATITISDQRKNGYLIPNQKLVVDTGLRAGFKLHDFVVVEQLGVANMYRKKAYLKRRSPKNHEYVITFIKV